MGAKDKKIQFRRIASVCIFLASVALYLLAVNNFIDNTDLVAMHRYVFVGMSLIFFAAFLVPLARWNGYIRPIRWKSKVWNTIWNILYFFGMVLVAAGIEELLWNDQAIHLTLKVIVLNYVIALIVAFALVMWIPKIWISYAVLLTVSFVYGLVNHFVYEFKGCPPMFNDIFAAKTAVTVMGSYTYAIDRQIAYCGVLFLLALASLSVTAPCDIKHSGKSKKRTIAVWCARILTPVLLILGVCHVDIGETFHLDFYGWRPERSFQDHGAPVTMLMSYQFSKPKKPDGYSEAKAKQILSAYEPEDASAGSDSGQKPIIIAIMNESFSDFHVLGDFDSDPYLSNWYAEDSYVMRGYVYSSVYGGGTCNSEFEFLTGNSMANVKAGTYPYQNYELQYTGSIVEYLRDTEGYDTVAFHPYKADNWNRPLVYEEFGFNDFLSMDDMDDPEYLTWTISDRADFGKMKDIFEEKAKEDQPFFLFNVTMQNHAGYSLEVLSEHRTPITIESDYSGYEDIVSYLTLMRESDIEFASFLEYLKQREEPVIVCMFGDHQPALSEDFLSAITIQDGENEVAQQQKLQMTPYMIWANYDTGLEQTDVNMSINYLGANLMKTAGYDTAYTDYLLELQREIPVVNACGYQTVDGKWHYIEEENAALQDYKIVQYYEIFDKNK